MAKLYTKNVWQDEILADEERYNILEDDDTPIESTVQIVLDTAVAQAGTAMDADIMNNIEEGIDAIDDRVDDLETEIGAVDARLVTVEGYSHFVPLTAPLTSTSWDGDSFSTTAKTLIDLSAVFGAPAGIKAVMVVVALRDSGSAAGDARLILGARNVSGEGIPFDCNGQANDTYEREFGIVPCDANGDIYYQTIATGANTLDIVIQIHGYWVV